MSAHNYNNLRLLQIIGALALFAILGVVALLIWTDLNNVSNAIQQAVDAPATKTGNIHSALLLIQGNIAQYTHQILLSILAATVFLFLIQVFLSYRIGRIAQTAQIAQRIAEDAVRTKARFLATMSHEIRTPMNGVIGMTRLLMNTPMSKKQSEFVESIHLSGEHLLTVINDVLDFS